MKSGKVHKKVVGSVLDQTNTWIFDDKNRSTTNMHKCGMWKSNAYSEKLSLGLPLVKGQQKKMQYQKQYKNTTGKRLLNGKYNEVS